MVHVVPQSKIPLDNKPKSLEVENNSQLLGSPFLTSSLQHTEKPFTVPIPRRTLFCHVPSAQ